jgi:predicted anti-sigma-YlaC factor YlaD
MSMHGLIRERLEDYLRGGPGRALPPEFEEHLRTCDQCREEVSWMQDQSQMLHVLAPPQAMDPRPGFYARVMERVEAQQSGSFWNLFLEPAFGRRIMATSLTLACLLGGYVAFTEASAKSPAAPNAEVIMAVQEHPANLGSNVQHDRETVLVSLATYRE